MKRSVISDAESVLRTYEITAETDPTHSVVIMDGVRYSDAKTLARYVVGKMRAMNINTRRNTWEELVLSGRVLRSTGRIDLTTSFAWLRQGWLSSIAVRNVIAAQEGCLITKVHPTCASLGNTRCRACNKTAETIEHVLASCSKWLVNIIY